MEKSTDWKHIADIVELFLKKNLTSDNKITPILAYAPDSPVKIKPNSPALKGLLDNSITTASYSHLSTLIKKNRRFEVEQKTFLVTEKGESEILSKKQAFFRHEVGQMEAYFNVTNIHFEKCPHVRVLRFKKSEMSQEEFKDIVELWRTQPRQT